MNTNRTSHGLVTGVALLLMGMCASAGAAPVPIYSVDSLEWQLLKSNPPQLVVIAKGQTNSLGWKDPKLVLRSSEGPGIISFDFVATPPSGPSGSALEDVEGLGVVKDVGRFVEIRVYASSNMIREQIITAALAGDSDDGKSADTPLNPFQVDFAAGSATCGLMQYTKASIVPGFINDTWFLVVEGIKTWSNIEVTLNPFVYIRKPEYWEIEVVGCMSGVGQPVELPYSVTIPLEGITGHDGIEVIGANKREKFLVPPRP